MYCFYMQAVLQLFLFTNLKSCKVPKSWKTKLKMYSQTCVQRPPSGPEKRGRYAQGCMKKISGK